MNKKTLIKFNCGVYKITNIENGKYYIGSSVNLKTRLSQHKSKLNKNTHHSKHFQFAWNKYGKDKFEYSIILYCSADNVLFYEQFALDVYEPTNAKKGYNTSQKAGNTSGVKQSEDQKKNHSKFMKGRPAWNKGIKMSEDQRIKLIGHSIGRIPWNKGIPISDEQKKKQSDKMKGRESPNKGKVCPNKGGTISEEHKLKISIANKGKSSWKKGKSMSEYEKEKLREANTGRKMTEETKIKMLETRKANQLAKSKS